MVALTYGGFWRRFFAFSIDNMLIYILSMAVMTAGMFFLGTSSGYQHIRPGAGLALDAIVRAALLFNALYLFLAMSYFTYFHGICGKTPGKMCFGLRVVRTNGEKLTFGMAFLRWIGYMLSSLPLNLGFLWVAFDARKQGFHDKLAGTVVILEYDQEAREGELRAPPPQ